MKARSLLPLSAIFLTLLFSCSKTNDAGMSKLQKMPVVNAVADTDPNTSTCYTTYFTTLLSPPSGYIPGTAETDLNTCLNTSWDLSGGTPGGPRLMPPAPPVVLTVPPPTLPPGTTSPPPVDQNMAYFTFFSVAGYGFFLHPRTLDEARDLFDHYAQIVCAAVAENITFPNPTNIDKSAAGVIYAFNHPEVFQSQDDHDMFLHFLGLVFAQPTFVISWSHGAPDTGGIITLPSSGCVNLRVRIPPFGGG
jgi:hypothetical protein